MVQVREFLMPISALPDHLNSPEEIENAFPDDDQYGTTWFGRLYRWYQKKTKSWFCFSYRCPERWARWRKYPKVLFAVGGPGPWRLESEEGDLASDYSYTGWYMGHCSPCYLSRIQYWKRWHFAIQWPLMTSCHFYLNAEDVPKFEEPRPDLDGKLWFFYWNHFDADLVYWMFTSIYLGRNWK